MHKQYFSIEITIIIGLLLLFVTCSAINTERGELKLSNNETKHYINNQIYVQWKPDIVNIENKSEDLTRIPELQEISTIKNIEEFPRNPSRESEVINLSTNESVTDALTRLRKDPRVLSAQPVFLKSLDLTPNDPLFPEQWGLDNNGQAISVELGNSGSDIDAERAWNVTTGSKNIIVAVIDTGIDYNHPDLVSNVWTNPGEISGNGIDDDGNGYIDDYHGWNFIDNNNEVMDVHGHGTGVAGILGAIGNNDLGIAGTAWNISIMPLKVVGSFNGDYEVYGPAEYEAMEYAKKMGASVIVCSWGIDDYDEKEFEEIVSFPQAVFICSAGNDGVNTDIISHYPSGYDVPNIISVAASDKNDDLAYFSNYGATTVDLAAPGIEIYTTAPGGKYEIKDGTSFSTPIVAGAAALLKSIDSTLTPTLIRKILIDTSDKKFSLYGKVFSNGRVNLFSAILAVESRLNGGLTVNSTPLQSDVYLNNVVYGKTPFTAPKLMRGEYNIEIVKPGYAPWTHNVTIIPGELVSVNATLKKQKTSGTTNQYGKIKITSNPQLAGVFLDSVYRGTTDLSILQVKTGTHQLVIRKEGYTTYNSTINVENGKTVQVVTNLSKVNHN